MTTTFILIRHAETIWNREKKLMGTANISLTKEGKEQAGRLAKHFQAYPFDVIFTSPLSRALQTAQTIHKLNKQIPLIINDDLHERDFGTAEGLNYDEVDANYPGLHYRNTWNYLHFRPNNGETLFEVKNRAIRFLASIITSYEGKKIVIVSHGTFLRVLACQILKIPLNKFSELRMDNTSFMLIQQSSSQGPTLQIANYNFHLKSRWQLP